MLVPPLRPVHHPYFFVTRERLDLIFEDRDYNADFDDRWLPWASWSDRFESAANEPDTAHAKGAG